MRIFLLVVYSAISISSFSQVRKDSCQFVVIGKVLDLQTKEPLPFADVHLENTTIGSATNMLGEFKIEHLCDKEIHLVVSYVGYKTTVHHHDLHHPMLQIFLAPDKLMLESVVIEAEHEPTGFKSVGSSMLDNELLNKYRSDNLGDALKNLSGLSTISTGQNIVKPVIHGLHSNRILIINNGIRHEYQNWGVDHAPEIDPSMADRLEVLKGASTVQYGPDALGGVILIHPKRFQLHTPLNGYIGLITQTNGLASGLNLGLAQGYERFSWIADASGDIQGDLHTPDYLLTNTGKRDWGASGGVRYHAKSADIEGYYSHFYQNLGILRGSVNGSLEDLERAVSSEPPLYTAPFTTFIHNPRQEVAHDLIKMKGTFFGQRNSVLLQYGYQNNRRKEFDVRRGTNNELPAIDLVLQTHSIEGIWYHLENNNHSGSMGMQMQFQINENIFGTNTIPFVPNFTNTRFGIFAIESWNRESATLEAGARYDYQYTSLKGRDGMNNPFSDQLDFHNVTATVGWIKEINSSSIFRTNLGTAWRAPNISELYAYGRHQSVYEYGIWRYTIDNSNNVIADGSVLTQSDKDIYSEMGFKWLNTLEIKKNKFSAEATGYINLIQNYYYSRPAGITSTVRGVFPFFIWDQTDALLWGFDLNMAYAHNPVFQSDFRVGYVWAQDISNHDVFVGIPPASITYSLTYKLFSTTKFNSTVQLVFDYNFKQYRAPRVVSVTELILAGEGGDPIFETDPSTFDILAPPDAYLLNHLYWSINFGRFEGIIQLRNLFNVSYRNYTDRMRYFADETGFNFISSITYKF